MLRPGRGSTRRARSHTADYLLKDPSCISVNSTAKDNDTVGNKGTIPFRRQSTPGPRTHLSDIELSADNWVVNIDVLGIKVLPNSRFMYVIEVTWAQGEKSQIVREYEDFFKYHCWLLDNFQEEAGLVNKFKRIIPYLPGKKIFRRNSLSLAEERQPLITVYMKELIKLPRVTKSAKAQAFFCWRPGDPKPDQDPVVFAINEKMGNGRLQSVKVQVLAGLNHVGDPVEQSSLLNSPKDMKGCHENTSFFEDLQ